MHRGTGKSAFAKHLSEMLDRPLIVKRASDLLSKYVGEAEKNIADIFREAESEGAVLLLDEADSFLCDRGLAQYQHEVTRVNEFLTQMEGFEGIFIASTNLMGNLDAASLRRFDFKIRFDYLKSKQSIALLRQVTGEAGEYAPSILRRIRELDTLTPGDIAVAVRRASINGEPLLVEILVDVLEKECELKNRGVRPFLGFRAA